MKLFLLFFTGSFFIVNVIQAMLVGQTQTAVQTAGHKVTETKVVVALRPRSKSALDHLSDIFSRLRVGATKTRPRSRSCDEKSVTIIPTSELIADVARRIDMTNPRLFCRSLNTILADRAFVQHYSLTPELLGLALRQIPRLNINMQDDHGLSCVHLAHKYGEANVLKVLLCAGACVNIQSALGRTPLGIMQISINIGTVQVLLAHGVDLTLRDSARKRVIELLPPEQAAIIKEADEKQTALLGSVETLMTTQLNLIDTLVAMIFTYGIC